jgi:hypothetical protein
VNVKRCGLLLAVVVLAAPACGGGSAKTVTVSKTVSVTSQATTGQETTTTTLAQPSETPTSFIKRLEPEFFANQWGLAWADLFPRDQAVISRSNYVVCKERQYANNDANLASVNVKKIYDEPLQPHGVGSTIATKAVTIHETWTFEGGSQQQTLTEHVANVGGRWRWFLPDKDYLAYTSGKCVDGSPLPSGRNKPGTQKQKVIRFSGNGTKQLPPVNVAKDSTLYWTHATSGGFSVDEDSGNVSVDSQARKGTTFVPSGTYGFKVYTYGDWTIVIK